MKRIFLPFLLAILLVGCSKEELPNVDADVIAFDIHTPDTYIYSDLNDLHMGWLEKSNHKDSTYYFKVDGDSLRLHINRNYAKCKYLDQGGSSMQGKQISVAINSNQHFSFRVYN